MTQPMTPEQEEQVRRALAAAAEAEDAATPTAMPEAVVARLDDVLAELVQGRTQTGSVPDDRDELARRRSRRRLNVLVAAAALVVIAAAGGAVVNGGLGGGGIGDASTTSSGAGGTAADDSARQPEALAPSASAGSGSGSARSVAEPRLRSTSLAADVRRVARTVNAAAPAGGDTQKYALRSDGVTCPAPAAPRGADVVDVLLDGVPATLVIDRVTDGEREARVYSCADPSAPVATTTVPAP